MTHSLRVLLVCGVLLGATAPTWAQRRPKVVSPLDGGVVLGDRLPLQVERTANPPECELDGQRITPQWTALPGRRRWFATLNLPSAGAHTLVVRNRRRTRRVRFTSGGLDTVGAGELVADRALDRKDVRRLDWLWGPAVLLEGLHAFAQVTPRHDRYVAELEAYHARHAQRGLPRIDYPDRCPSALSAVALDRVEGKAVGMPSARIVADYLRTERRNALGAIDHLGSDSRMRTLAMLGGRILQALGLNTFVSHLHDSIWVDSLVMYALTAVEYGRHTGDVTLTEFGLEQPGIFARVLQDPQDGLFHHAWDVEHPGTLGIRWLRGNGWVAYSVVEMLDGLPTSHPRHAELSAILRALADGLMARQDAAGLWPTDLDDPDTYQEASGSALAAFALARGARLGVLPASARDRARRTFRSLTARLRPRSVGASVTGTSVATNIGPALFYRLTPQRDDVEWGIGGYLLLASELHAETW